MKATALTTLILLLVVGAAATAQAAAALLLMTLALHLKRSSAPFPTPHRLLLDPMCCFRLLLVFIKKASALFLQLFARSVSALPVTAIAYAALQALLEVEMTSPNRLPLPMLKPIHELLATAMVLSKATAKLALLQLASAALADGLTSMNATLEHLHLAFALTTASSVLRVSRLS